MEMHAIDAAEFANGNGEEKEEPKGAELLFQICDDASWNRVSTFSGSSGTDRASDLDGVIVRGSASYAGPSIRRTQNSENVTLVVIALQNPDEEYACSQHLNIYYSGLLTGACAKVTIIFVSRGRYG